MGFEFGLKPNAIWAKFSGGLKGINNGPNTLYGQVRYSKAYDRTKSLSYDIYNGGSGWFGLSTARICENLN